jgi:hypothetical protein
MSSIGFHAEGLAVIRQTITCDTCGIERKQANHWFEAFEHEGELRIRGLIPTKTTRPGLKHLCGQTCLHRLVDDFLASNLSSRMFGIHEGARTPTDFAELAAKALSTPEELNCVDFESSARLVETPKPKPVVVSRPRRTVKQPSVEKSKPSLAASSTSPATKLLADSETVSAKAKPASPPIVAPASAEVVSPGRSAPATASVAQPLAPGSAKSIPARRPTPIHLSASSDTGPALQALSPLTPQARRAQAWERERAREKLSANANLRNGKIQKLL